MIDLDSKRPMPKDGLFRLASMSKSITGVALTMLVEEGKIISIYFIQGGSGGALRQDFENAVYQSIVAP